MSVIIHTEDPQSSPFYRNAKIGRVQENRGEDGGRRVVPSSGRNAYSVRSPAAQPAHRVGVSARPPATPSSCHPTPTLSFWRGRRGDRRRICFFKSRLPLDKVPLSVNMPVGFKRPSLR